MSTARWIVDGSGTNGTHTTIASAITSASTGIGQSTIFILPGTYTENLTLFPGVNLTAYTCDGYTPGVIINGKCTFTQAGSVSLSGIQLQTNSDFALAVTGSDASVVNLIDCYINATNNTAISYTSTSAGSSILISNTNGNLSAAGITYFVATGAGTIRINHGIYNNSGNSTTPSTTSACRVFIEYVQGAFVAACTSTGSFALINSTLTGATTNTTALTIAGNQTSNITFSSLGSGTSSALSVGAGTIVVLIGEINSTNANAIVGAGTLELGESVFSNSSSTIQNTVTIVPFVTRFGDIKANSITFGAGNPLSTYVTSTWIPDVQINSSSVGITYTTQLGGYTQIGNVVTFWAIVLLSSKGASVGSVTISNLPVATSANGANQAISVSAFGQVTAAGSSGLVLLLQSNNTIGQFAVTFSPGGTNTTGITDANITNTFNFVFNGSYIIN